MGDEVGDDGVGVEQDLGALAPLARGCGDEGRGVLARGVGEQFADEPADLAAEVAAGGLVGLWFGGAVLQGAGAVVVALLVDLRPDFEAALAVVRGLRRGLHLKDVRGGHALASWACEGSASSSGGR